MAAKQFLLSLTLLVLIYLSSVVAAWAQDWKTVKGVVMDTVANTTLAQVTIQTEDGVIQSTSLENGTFSIAVPDQSTHLIFSLEGYETMKLEVEDKISIKVHLTAVANRKGKYLNQGYGYTSRDQVTSAFSVLNAQEFNLGNINDPAELWMAKVAGLGVYKKGDDPNAEALMRIRGLISLENNVSPLIVIDNVVAASLENLDPNDIENIQVLRDGAAAAIYGIRGSQGVILIETKKGQRNTPVSVNYRGYVAAATVSNEHPALNREEYLSVGGNDLGSDTNWQDEVAKTGISQMHHISVSGGSNNTIYRASVNYRDINGILKNSGFDQVNARIGLTQFALKNKLKINLNSSYTDRNIDYSFVEAFRYATVSNPTQPIKFDNGNYYQPIIFDNFNPMAILDLNVNEGKRQIINFNLQMDYAISDHISIYANYAQQNRTELNGEYYSRSSFFRGYYRGGLASRYTSDDNFRLFESYLNYNNEFGKVILDFTAGYSYQQSEFEDIYMELGNFPNDQLGYNALQNAADLLSVTDEEADIQSYTSPRDKVVAFFGRFNLNIGENIFVNGSLRREGSSKLGTDNQWGSFPAIGAGINLSNFLNFNFLNELKFRTGFGVTGALPDQSGLSQSIYQYYTDNGGIIVQTNAANPDLGWEEKREWNFGLDFRLADKLSGSFDLYRRKIDNLIVQSRLEEEGRRLNVYQNSGALKTNGFEFHLRYNQLKIGDITWTSDLVLNSYKTTLEKYPVDSGMVGWAGAPGQGSLQFLKFQVGEELGQFWGPLFSGDINSFGAQELVDINGDGQLLTFPSAALLPDGDYTVLGNGFPDYELGFSNYFSFKNWHLNFLFRGIFGHSLINTQRYFYEPIDPGAINSYNRVITEKAVEGLTFSQFSSLYVEKADFFSLENISLGYELSFNQSSALKSIILNFTVQNAFTLTNYTGLDPEPNLIDFGPTDNGSSIRNRSAELMAPGIDRRNEYFPARTYTFGLQATF
jgi:TonB-linked SusC/RagA family outer membrane protein